MGLAIRLLGTPAIEQDGVRRPPPRGHKPWALLALLVLSDAPLSRERLAGLLFSDADDPLGSLRWNLAELRRLWPQARVQGDPVELELPADTQVDARTLVAGDVGPKASSTYSEPRSGAAERASKPATGRRVRRRGSPRGSVADTRGIGHRGVLREGRRLRELAAGDPPLGGGARARPDRPEPSPAGPTAGAARQGSSAASRADHRHR